MDACETVLRITAYSFPTRRALPGRAYAAKRLTVAEAILNQIGLPVSVLIDTFYRQIIMTGGVPYSLTVPKLPIRDGLTDEQFDAMMEKGYNQAKSGEGLPASEAFSKIREGICGMR